MEPFYRLIGVDTSNLTKKEIQLLEAELFAHVCEELKEGFRKQYRDYFRLMKFTKEKENKMLEANFLRLIIRDILSTEEYDLTGVAYYTESHEDVIQEVIDGRNTNPSAKLFRRSIDLHRAVRRNLYHSIVKKIITTPLPFLG